MVQTSTTEREAFSRRLHLAIDHAWGDSRRHGRAVWLAENLPYKITPKATGRWLNGETMPSRENMAPLAKLLGVSKAWLSDGEEAREYRSAEPSAEYQRAARVAEKKLGLSPGAIPANTDVSFSQESLETLLEAIISALPLMSSDQKKKLLREISETL